MYGMAHDGMCFVMFFFPVFFGDTVYAPRSPVNKMFLTAMAVAMPRSIANEAETAKEHREAAKA